MYVYTNFLTKIPYILLVESFMEKYPNAVRKWKKLKGKGCGVLHEVDVDTMRQHPLLDDKLFDRIVFNFPHAGFIGMESQRFQIE